MLPVMPPGLPTAVSGSNKAKPFPQSRRKRQNLSFTQRTNSLRLNIRATCRFRHSSITSVSPHRVQQLGPDQSHRLVTNRPARSILANITSIGTSNPSGLRSFE